MLDVLGEADPSRHHLATPLDVLVVQFVEEALRSNEGTIAESLESEWKYKGAM